MSDRQVTERDFRKPEFADADPKDYEFREDGAVVRKDRWERGLRAIASTVIGDRREWEISEVVEAVRKLAENQNTDHHPRPSLADEGEKV